MRISQTNFCFPRFKTDISDNDGIILLGVRNYTKRPSILTSHCIAWRLYVPDIFNSSPQQLTFKYKVFDNYHTMIIFITVSVLFCSTQCVYIITSKINTTHAYLPPVTYHTIVK